MTELEKILTGDDLKAQRALFAFDSTNSVDEIVIKYNLWMRKLLMRYLKSADAPFHEELDRGNIRAYIGELLQFVDIAYRGAAKTARTKTFLAYAILNDLEHHRRFIRVLSADIENAKQSVTDIYNIMVQPGVKTMYPEIFERTDAKREERMDSLTTATGVKLIAKQIMVDQRGKIADDAKSDLDWYDDIETRSTIRSAVDTKKIAENMEEARTGLAQGGASIYTANYFSELGNVHQLVTKNMDDARPVGQFTKEYEGKAVMIVPIWDEKKVPTWSRYTKEEIEKMRNTDEDFEGERLCRPNASKDVYFPRDMLDRMPDREPIKEISGFRMYREYKPGHRYALGADVAGGVGLDSSTTVVIDFDTMPAQVVATFANNTIDTEAFGDEMVAQANRYGGCLIAPENNKFDQAVLKAKLLGAKLYKTRSGKEVQVGYHAPAKYGWETNSLTKSKMLAGLRSAVSDGLIELNDPALKREAMSYTRNDLIDNAPDIRLTTRHFDLLIACAIAWQMKDHAEASSKIVNDPNAIYEQPARDAWARKQKVNPAR